ncbi:MAG: TfoX/Sxy family protein [Candidatus Hydrogenedentes bacterium]|nr:TfoX/Sxy family protein [Candidatus Hydrogenedentota bacterium]
MKPQPAVVEYALDILSVFGPIQARSMFGGWGLYHDGLMFGLIVDETIYLKTDDHNRPDFEAMDAHPFEYETKSGKTAVMPYHEIPASVQEDRDALRVWCQRSYEAALRSKQPAPAKKSRARKT